MQRINDLALRGDSLCYHRKCSVDPILRTSQRDTLLGLGCRHTFLRDLSVRIRKTEDQFPREGLIAEKAGEIQHHRLSIRG